MYATGYAFNAFDLFEKYPISVIPTEVKHQFGLSKRELAASVFIKCCQLVLIDILENDVDFQLKFYKSTGSLRIQPVSDEKFKIARKNGTFKNVDYYASMFTGYQYTFEMNRCNRVIKIKHVYVWGKLSKKLVEYTNQGRSWSGLHIKTLEDYLEQMQEVFPNIPMRVLTSILKYGWKTLYYYNCGGYDTVVSNSTTWFYIGRLTNDSLKHYFYYCKKLKAKIRKVYMLRRTKWDGYYYFALGNKQYADYEAQKNKRGRPRTIFNLGKVVLFRILDECKISAPRLPYIFRIGDLDYQGYSIYKKDFIAHGPELIMKRDPWKMSDILIQSKNFDLV